MRRLMVPVLAGQEIPPIVKLNKLLHALVRGKGESSIVHYRQGK